MDIVIASAARTPIGAFQGALAPLPAPLLGAAAVRGAVDRAGLDAADVDLVLMGNVLSAGQGQAPARQAAIRAGLSQATPAVTLNKMCGSGMETVIQAARAIAVGDARIVVAGGMESMSNAPYLLPGARGGLRLGHAQALDSLIHDGLWDVYEDVHMGSCAELCAREYRFGREEQDAFAARSYRRAQEAIRSGAAAHEIVPVEVPGRKGAVTVVEEDEGPHAVDFGRLPTLRPAFEKDGTVTAANASTINDGAAALVIASREEAERRGLPVLATLRGWTAHAQDPAWFTTAPVAALRALFDKLAWSPDEVTRYEVNEAFSVVTMAAMREFDLSEDRVDVLGGAVALGHPIGASGARILVTLLNALRLAGGGRGVAAICIGGGEALAMGLETEEG
jgi:acetyl-CoA C-acetyltransferase